MDVKDIIRAGDLLLEGHPWAQTNPAWLPHPLRYFAKMIKEQDTPDTVWTIAVSPAHSTWGAWACHQLYDVTGQVPRMEIAVSYGKTTTWRNTIYDPDACKWTDRAGNLTLEVDRCNSKFRRDFANAGFWEPPEETGKWHWFTRHAAMNVHLFRDGYAYFKYRHRITDWYDQEKRQVKTDRYCHDCGTRKLIKRFKKGNAYYWCPCTGSAPVGEIKGTCPHCGEQVRVQTQNLVHFKKCVAYPRCSYVEPLG
jgi:hypothetical protein